MDTVGDANEHSSWASSVNSQKNYVPRRNNISHTPHSMISGTVTVIKLHAAQPHNKITISCGLQAKFDMPNGSILCQFSGGKPEPIVVL